MSLCRYERPTSPALVELANRGIRFERAQAASSWTLPSHASLFTGRWPHELSAGWFTPLDGARPTLAEFLGSQGYATAGFIANSWYCSVDSGLARGFGTYRDYTFPRLTACSMATLVDRPIAGLEAIASFLEERLNFDLLRPAVERLWWLFKSNRKDAALVNREFLAWLSSRPQPERPFFAFLNFYDAHAPYQLSEDDIHRFGTTPRNTEEAAWLRDWLRVIHKRPTRQQIDFVRDAYDDCIADLDEQIGWLCDELERRGTLAHTWVIITADHGESFGEQPTVFWHGTSLYQSQVHVPLVIVPPHGGPAPRVVNETVSLRDLAATIVDVLDFRAGSPFPGVSLARFWNERAAIVADGEPAPALAEVVPLGKAQADPSEWLREARWPVAALTDGDWAYVRSPEDGREELFALHDDALQQHNLAADPAARPALERMRAFLDRLTGGPLTPQRFRP